MGGLDPIGAGRWIFSRRVKLHDDDHGEGTFDDWYLLLAMPPLSCDGLGVVIIPCMQDGNRDEEHHEQKYKV